jgi:RNA-directed DNA polymerase
MKIRSVDQLGMLLGFDSDFLRRTLKNRQRYEKTVLKEIKGKTREIYTSRGPLKEIQARIKKLLDKECEHGISHAQKGRSTYTNASVHESNTVLLTVDIKNFFPSISVQNIFGLFVKLGCTKPVARVLSRFVTYDSKLPQGASTSQKLSSLYVATLDKRIADFCGKRGLAVSRYVDDISISGAGAEKVRSAVVSMIEKAGFTVQDKKTTLRFRHEKQIVTGLSVNTRTGVGRAARKQLRAICHACSKRGLESVAKEHGYDEVDKFTAFLQGKLSYAGLERPEWRLKMLEIANLR